MTHREIAIRYAWSWLGRAYRWAGDDPSGIDCSGLIIEILQGVGLIPHGWDGSAQMIFNRFRIHEIDEADRRPGVLVFYRNAAGLITHVGIILDRDVVLQAGGGGSSTLTEADAWKQNAFVKLRPIDYRADARLCVDPFIAFGED